MTDRPDNGTALAEHTDESVEGTQELVETDVLVEEVSIDGMCGVY
jgi:mycofactocin precursor